MQIKILYYETIDSTNEEAKRNLNFEEFTVFLAETQTSGKGRNSRTWYSPPYENLYFSFILKPKINKKSFSCIPIIAGYSVLKTLKKIINKKIEIKWPNDILVENKKICGILTEVKKDTVIIGIGINVNTQKFPEFQKNTPTSIFLETSQKHDRLKILNSFFKEFMAIYPKFLKEQKIPENILNDINKNLFLRDKNAIIEFKNEKISGIIEKINSDGSLNLNGKKIFAGDIIKLFHSKSNFS